MSARLLLVRHARSTWNAERRIQGVADPPLDEMGLEQARRIADRLRSQSLSAIYSSPLQRARVTAEIIHRYFLDAPMSLDDRLQEYDFGVVNGLTWDEVALQHPTLAERWLEDPWTIPIPGSEGQPAFRARVMAAMNEIVAQHDHEQVAVVAHGGTFAAYLGAKLELPIDRRYPFHFGNTSLSVVEANGQTLDIVALNDTNHLSGLAGMALI